MLARQVDEVPEVEGEAVVQQVLEHPHLVVGHHLLHEAVRLLGGQVVGGAPDGPLLRHPGLAVVVVHLVVDDHVRNVSSRIFHCVLF